MHEGNEQARKLAIAAIEAKRETQGNLAKVVGSTRSMMSLFISGQRNFKRPMLSKLLAHFGKMLFVSIDDMDGKPPRKRKA